ncbi:sensor histidine kinase [Thiothrix winogradskyi]|uniref:histidine kinase n=1 Tax=Thiothrix winogradskyi TaxID=96472 RepID=A0ABY3T2P5_9GAMM|nr:HAMP domain-containing sensor histidine kinase [Thiothrix winogradskyi]UJS25484.1 HAMP domain-containing histidine kinase [Thiothrix winogradskyi]
MQAFRQFWHPLRRRIQAVMALYLLIISVLVMTNLWATHYLGYLLERSDKSHQQLQALQRLHGDIHQHFSRQIAVLLQDKATPALSDSTQQIQARFQALVTISHQEAALVQTHDKAAEFAEIDHFQRMQHELNHLLRVANQPPVTSENNMHAKLQWFSGTVLALYQQNLQPLLDAALTDEQAELHTVKQTHRELQQYMHLIITVMVVMSVVAALTLVYLLTARTRSLQTSNAHLRQTDHNRRRFLEDVSHELRSPLTVMMGEADIALLNPQADNTLYRQTLDVILANSAYLQRRIQDLLAVARAENGVLRLQFAPVEWCKLLQDTVRTIQGFANSRQVVIQLALPDHAVTMTGDADWLRQLLMTLLDNAIKFTPAGGTITLSLQAETGKIALRIHDTGIGIAPENLPHLFERYYQANPNTQAHHGRGYGLGMGIARWIVEQHHGEVNVSSLPNVGTSIAIVF